MDVVIEHFAKVPLFDYAISFYESIIENADSRTQTWPMMSSPLYPLTIVFLYLYMVLHGRHIVMRKFFPVNNVDITRHLRAYNFGVLGLNLIMGLCFSWHINAANYSFKCQPIRSNSSSSYHEDALAQLIYLFFCSKILEFIDTFFLIIKRKERQLTFLHWYHHSTIVIATWIGVRFVPGGSTAIIAMVNSWVHVVMYFYYWMMACGKKQYISYKKFVTIMQIVQFMATILHCISALKADCQYPRWILIWLMLYMMSFLALFIHFYIQTYSYNPRLTSASSHTQGNGLSSPSLTTKSSAKKN